MLLDPIMMLAGSRAGRLRRGLLIAGALLLAGHALAAPKAAEAAGADVLKARCAGCHLENGKLQRISGLRKTPEGWDMTIARMQTWHKVDISREERRVLVKYLADRQGLAPDETAAYRFLIERVPNMQDVVPTKELGEMCARCHSFGRIALQRREPAEWKKLVHTHLGQFPSIEYSAGGRDRHWRDIAFDETVPALAKLYPADTASWKKWQAAKHVLPVGKWRVAGRRPGAGDYAGTMQVDALGNDRYDVRYELNYENGSRMSGRGQTILYSGYEWRGDAMLGNQRVRSVFALSADGKRLSGRWFLRDADEIGASFTAVPMASVPRGTILAAYPELLKAGGDTTLRVHGVQLGKEFDLGPGIQVVSVDQKNPDEAELLVRVAADAAPGPRSLRGAGGSAARLAVYRQFDSVRVEPEFGLARLGGGATLGLAAQFEAVAYLNGPDGKAGTEDDVRLGYTTATWRADNYDERAKASEDARYAGVMEPQGLFVPAAAGPNPARKGFNNVGDLAVIATVTDGEHTSEAKGRLIVTVQRWNKPPLR